MAAAADSPKWFEKWLQDGGLFPHTNLLGQDLLIPPDSFDREAAIMAVACDLIQLAPPEAFLSIKEWLPASLVEAYLSHQEHFDLGRYARLTESDVFAPSTEGSLQYAVSAVMHL